MPIFLKALYLENYRGIGAEQAMTGFETFNFFIGANNAGKSTVLNFISKHLPIEKGMKAQLNGVDLLEYHGTLSTTKVGMGIGIDTDDAKADFYEKYPYLFVDQFRQVIDRAFTYFSDADVIWASSQIPYDNVKLELPYDYEELHGTIPAHMWHRVFLMLQTNGQFSQTGNPYSESDIKERAIPHLVSAIKTTLPLQLPDTKLIPAIRQIGPTGADFLDFSGSGLIDRLATIQNPDHQNHRSDRDLFDKINGFLQAVTDRPNSKIEIPNTKAHILVHMDDRILPLSSLGTGIHEVVMIAAFCTLSQDEIICIEEPEIHLYPLLQRKLIRYLKQETTNQYFIATHSASFIDTPGAAIFHVTQENGETRISRAKLNQDRHAICADLGHRASDIIQSNAVLWVEGPSDRIYLKHWIGLANDELIEGIHYSIMFYGGRLLSHLSADDDDVDEFIELRALNRNLAVMIDSDKKGIRESINATKQRLCDEFKKHGGIAWVTKGREVENYIDPDVLQEAVKAVHSATYNGPVSVGRFDHALHYVPKPTRRTRAKKAVVDIAGTNVDKVRVARKVIESGKVTLDVLDLKARINNIVAMIERANR